MREILNCMEDINLDDYEYCKLIEDTLHYAQSFNLHIPKLMGGIPFDKKKNWTEDVSDKVYVNSDACKITPAKKISCQNYINVKRHFDTDFEYRARPDRKIARGTNFILHAMYGNPQDMYVERVI